MITQYLEPYLIQIAEYGYEARLYKCGNRVDGKLSTTTCKLYTI